MFNGKTVLLSPKEGIEKIIPKTEEVFHFQKEKTLYKPFWTAVAGLSMIGLSIYFGFVKNTTKLSHYLGGTGITVAFIIIGVLLYCLLGKSSPSFNKKSDDGKLYNQHSERIEGIAPIITTNENELTGNAQNNQPTRPTK